MIKLFGFRLIYSDILWSQLGIKEKSTSFKEGICKQSSNLKEVFFENQVWRAGSLHLGLETLLSQNTMSSILDNSLTLMRRRRNKIKWSKKRISGSTLHIQVVSECSKSLKEQLNLLKKRSKPRTIRNQKRLIMEPTFLRGKKFLQN